MSLASITWVILDFLISPARESCTWQVRPLRWQRVLLVGACSGKYCKEGLAHALPGANLPLATLVTFILWLGWFRFNGDSVLKLGEATSTNSVAMVFLDTNAAAAGGAVAGLSQHGCCLAGQTWRCS